MFDQLNDLIKHDDESQKKFENFKTSFAKRQEGQNKLASTRAKTTAVVLGAATIVSIIFLVFAFNQYSKVEQATAKIEQLELQLKECED